MTAARQSMISRMVRFILRMFPLKTIPEKKYQAGSFRTTNDPAFA
jgi:hypothetical protein